MKEPFQSGLGIATEIPGPIRYENSSKTAKITCMKVYEVLQRAPSVDGACLQSTENRMPLGSCDKQLWFALDYLNN